MGYGGWGYRGAEFKSSRDKELKRKRDGEWGRQRGEPVNMN
jgi:hypothetical protein